MGRKIFEPASAERTRARVLPDVGAIAAEAAEFDVVLVRRVPRFVQKDQLMLGSIEATLSGIGFDPNNQVLELAVNLTPYGKDVVGVSPSMQI